MKKTVMNRNFLLTVTSQMFKFTFTEPITQYLEY